MKVNFRFSGNVILTFGNTVQVNCESNVSYATFAIDRYITSGREILPQIRTGDVIRSAKLIEGQDRLVLPNES